MAFRAFLSWIQVWFSATGADKQDTRHSWHKQLAAYMSDGVLGPSFGPVAATVGSILDLGWKLVSPDFWVIDSTTSVTLDQQPFTRMQLIARATDDMQKQTWKAAAKPSTDLDWNWECLHLQRPRKR